MKTIFRCAYQLSVLLLLTLTSCQSEVKEKKKILRLNIASQPTTLDPRKARDLQSINLAMMLYEGLTRIGPNNSEELALAESVTCSEDLKTYTFKLRSSNWSNNESLTAYDFEYSWKKVLSPNFLSDYAYQLFVIKNGEKAKFGKISLDEVGVKAVDDYTLQVELENPTPYFLKLTAFPTFYPICFSNEQNHPEWSDNLSTYVSNGPFTLSSIRCEDHIEVKKNLHYWDSKEVNLDGISMCMVDGQTEIMMYEKKELDWAGSPSSVLPIECLSHWRNAKQLHCSDVLGTFFLRTNIDNPLLSNTAFRKALGLAINRKEITEHVLQGGQRPAMRLLPPSLSMSKYECFEDGDAACAKEIFSQALEEMGYTLDTLPVLTISYVNQPRVHRTAQVLQQQWREVLGYHIKLQSMEPKTYFQKISQQDYEIAAGSWFADFCDPISFFNVFYSKNCSTNNTNWEDMEYKKLLDKSCVTHDQSMREKMFFEAEEILMDAMPIIPIFYHTMLYLKDENLENISVTSLGTVDFKWANIKGGQ